MPQLSPKVDIGELLGFPAYRAIHYAIDHSLVLHAAKEKFHVVVEILLSRRSVGQVEDLVGEPGCDGSQILIWDGFQPLLRFLSLMTRPQQDNFSRRDISRGQSLKVAAAA